MIEWLAKFGTWNWLVIGLVLMGLELIAPGVFLLWLGLAALVVGVLSFGIDWSWQTQIIVFAILSIAAVPLWRSVARRNAAVTDNPHLNRRSDALVGRTFTLDKPIVDGTGTVRIDDTVWRVSGPDAPAGSRVQVVKSDGASLVVGLA
ncbi:MAG: hypothetical protein A4S14_14365 [Proteobacteria bacterium SG_bin9]|nr:MAG: hypothetical protein A4S14_14365 [Proteobacteria bacterium SG_bin9]